MNFSISAFVTTADFYWTSNLLTIGSDFDRFFSDGEHLSGANRISRRAQTLANTKKSDPQKLWATHGTLRCPIFERVSAGLGSPLVVARHHPRPQISPSIQRVYIRRIIDKSRHWLFCPTTYYHQGILPLICSERGRLNRHCTVAYIGCSHLFSKKNLY